MNYQVEVKFVAGHNIFDTFETLREAHAFLDKVPEVFSDPIKTSTITDVTMGEVKGLIYYRKHAYDRTSKNHEVQQQQPEVVRVLFSEPVMSGVRTVTLIPQEDGTFLANILE